MISLPLFFPKLLSSAILGYNEMRNILPEEHPAHGKIKKLNPSPLNDSDAGPSVRSTEGGYSDRGRGASSLNYSL